MGPVPKAIAGDGNSHALSSRSTQIAQQNCSAAGGSSTMYTAPARTRFGKARWSQEGSRGTWR